MRLAGWLEAITTWVGRLAAWAIVGLMLVILTDVILRRYINVGSTRLQELEWHLHGTLFLLMLGYGYLKGSHVRIDLFRERWAPKTKVVIEFLGCLLLFLPYCFAVLYFAFDYAAMSWSFSETSASPTGLPMRWIIKGVLFGGFVFLTFAGLAVLIRSALYLFGPAALRPQIPMKHILDDPPEAT